MTEIDARTRLRMERHRAARDDFAFWIYRLATAALAEQDAEIARLKDELADAQHRPVLHATGMQCEKIIASGEADGELPGTLLRSTDDTRSWERTAVGWQIR
jgi:hypothetical protein